MRIAGEPLDSDDPSAVIRRLLELGREDLARPVYGDHAVTAMIGEDLQRAARDAGCDLLLTPRRQPIPRRRGWNVKLINRKLRTYKDVHAAWTDDNQASGDEHGVWLSLLYDLDEHASIDYPDRDNGQPGLCADRVFFHHITSGRFTSENLVERPPSDGSVRAIFVPIDHAR